MDDIKTDRSLPHSFMVGVLGILSGAIWNGPLWFIVFIIFVPIIWSTLRTYESVIFIFSYYLFSLKSLPILLSRYDNDYSHEYFLKFILWWILYASFLALPWVIVKIILYKSNPSPWIESITPIIPLIVGLIPPFYVFGVANPVEGAGIFFPGMGLLGIFIYFVIIIIMSVIINKTVKIRLVYPLVGLILFSIYCNENFKQPLPPKNWVAVSTQLAPQTNQSEIHKKYIFLLNLLKRLIDNGYHVIVLPENAIGLLQQKTKNMWDKIGDYAKARNVTILSGAVILDSQKNNKQLDGGIVAFGKESGVVYLTRQPVPFTEWIPFSEKGERVHWFSKGIHSFYHLNVEFLVCYEELLPGLVISPFLSLDKPNLLISVANNWMGKGTGERHEQLDSVLVLSRLFGIPLIRSWNR